MTALALVISIIFVLNVGALLLVRGGRYANRPIDNGPTILRAAPKPTDWAAHEAEAGR